MYQINPFKLEILVSPRIVSKNTCFLNERHSHAIIFERSNKPHANVMRINTNIVKHKSLCMYLNVNNVKSVSVLARYSK